MDFVPQSIHELTEQARVHVKKAPSAMRQRFCSVHPLPQ